MRSDSPTHRFGELAMTVTERISDAAKRASDEYNLHRVADPFGNIGKWIAVRLSDGTSDHVLYDSKTSAVRGQHHNENFYAYVQIGPWPFSPNDAETYLRKNREMYDAGFRLADRNAENGGLDAIPRITEVDERNRFAALFGKGKPSNIIIPGLGRF